MQGRWFSPPITNVTERAKLCPADKGGQELHLTVIVQKQQQFTAHVP